MICIVRFKQAETDEILGYLEGEKANDVYVQSVLLVDTILHNNNIGSYPSWSIAKCGCEFGCHVPGWGRYHIFELKML